MQAGFAVAAIIHLLPVAGLLGAVALHRAYGLEITDPDLLLLLRHRALMFGLLGAALAIAIWRAPWRRPMWCMGMISAAGFILLALGGSHSAAIWRIVSGDAIAVAALLLAAPAVWRRERSIAT